MILTCKTCDKELKHFKIWELEDIKDFKNREMFIVNCSSCRTITVALKEERLSDGKIFVNKILSERDSLRTIARESKRLIKEYVTADCTVLNGWIYGTNKEIKNKKGEVVQVRQYSSDFFNRKELVKKIFLK
ncbi:MAG: hypothetical protein IJ301_02040 [Clostridia bacterium]|nr:hypothetical protein [Clostridia bacterium]